MHLAKFYDCNLFSVIPLKNRKERRSLQSWKSSTTASPSLKRWRILIRPGSALSTTLAWPVRSQVSAPTRLLLSAQRDVKACFKVVLCFARRRPAHPASRRSVCLHQEGGPRCVRGDRCMELPLPDRHLQVCPCSGVWWVFNSVYFHIIIIILSFCLFVQQSCVSSLIISCADCNLQCYAVAFRECDGV